MDKHCARFVKRLPAPCVQLEAQIDIIESHWEFLLVESPNREKLLPVHDHAGRGNGTDALGQAMAHEIARIIAAQVAMSVSGSSPDTNHHSGMLHRSVGIK